MENGFDDIWEMAKTEGITIGEERGISIGEKRGISNGILQCILGFQNKNNCTFDEAADAIGVSRETVAQLKASGLVQA